MVGTIAHSRRAAEGDRESRAAAARERALDHERVRRSDYMPRQPVFRRIGDHGQEDPWKNSRSTAGPELGDYLGLPINAAARLKADSWDASIQTLPEWQCRPHSADYIWRGPSTFRISKEVDPVTRELVAFHAEWVLAPVLRGRVSGGSGIYPSYAPPL